jgi:hypothetical protein
MELLKNEFETVILNQEYKLPETSFYNYINEDEIDDDLKCMYICHNVLTNPISHNECENSFCKECIDKCNYICPLCRKGKRNQYNIIKTRIILNQLNKILIKCNKCDTNMQRGEFNNHINLCMFNCPLKCSTKINNKLFNEHKNICSEFIIKCPIGCNNYIKRQNLTQHDSICSEKSIKCFSCGINIKRWKINEHDIACPNKEINCLCNNNILRKNLTSHMNDCNYFRLRPIIEYFNAKIKTLESDNQNLRMLLAKIT